MSREKKLRSQGAVNSVFEQSFARIYITPYFDNSEDIIKKFYDDNPISSIPNSEISGWYGGDSETGLILARARRVRNLVMAKNIEVLKLNSPNISLSTRNQIEDFLTKQTTDGTYVTDAYFYKLFSLNGFLSQDEFAVYGDYLNEHWDRDVDNLLNLRLEPGPYTDAIVKHIEGEILTFYPNLSKKDKTLIESLTKEELIYLVGLDKEMLWSNLNAVGMKLQLLLDEKDKTTRSKDYGTVYNTLFLLFVKAVANDPKIDNPHMRMFKFQEKLMDTMSSKFSDKPQYLSNSVVSADSIWAIVDFLNKNISSFRSREMLALLLALNNRSACVKDGTLTQWIKFLNKALDKQTDEDNIEFFKLLAEIVLRNKNSVPTLKDWNKALDDGVLTNTMTMDITLMFIISDPSEDGDYRKAQQIDFQNLFV